MFRTPATVTTALLVALAGCLAAEAPTEPAAASSASAASSATGAGFELAGTTCREAGGHSAHPLFEDYLPAPWKPADVTEDTGPVLLTSEWWSHPIESLTVQETMGNYHAVVACDGWTFNGEEKPDLLFGFVGMKIEAPPFDDASAPGVRHYLVTVLGSSDEDVNTALHGAGFHATMSKGVHETTGGGWIRALLDTADHGVYESIVPLEEEGPLDEGVYRLWWQKENEDGTFAPIALDMATTGGTHLWTPNKYGYFSHLRTEDHAPIPGAVGEIPGLGYDGFDRVITLGVRPDVQLDEAYIHQ